MTETLIKNVSDTAFWTAYHRALETERDDALFHDPFARLLAGDRGKNIAETMPASFLTRWVVVTRTCIIDGYIRSAIRKGVGMVLNLGAGLDTRPYRMAELPESLIWIEADYPKVIEYKEKLLSGTRPHCRLERVKLDLANVGERRQLFGRMHEQAKKIAVLTEGVIPYLSEDAVRVLAEDLKQIDCAHYWIAEYFSPEIVTWRERAMTSKMENARFRFAPKDWFAFFLEHGWRPKEIRYLLEESVRLGRPITLPLPIKIGLTLRKLFSSRKQRVAFNKAAAYVLLERV